MAGLSLKLDSNRRDEGRKDISDYDVSKTVLNTPFIRHPSTSVIDSKFFSFKMYIEPVSNPEPLVVNASRILNHSSNALAEQLERNPNGKLHRIQKICCIGAGYVVS